MGAGAQDASGGAHERSYFEVQREGLMREVGSVSTLDGMLRGRDSAGKVEEARIEL